MEVYTGYGDKGMTDLSHTKNVSKSDDRICLMGSVEELMSHIGLVRVLVDDVDVVRMLEKISETLKKIIDGVSDPYNREFKVSEDRTELLEEEIGRMKEIFSGERLPILPGDSRVAAEIDVTRAVARRAERELALVSVKFGSDTGAKKYMNRLSDYFYVLARYVDVAKIEEKKTDISESVQKSVKAETAGIEANVGVEAVGTVGSSADVAAGTSAVDVRAQDSQMVQKRDVQAFDVQNGTVTTAVGGGMIRDLILGITPPVMFQDASYALAAVATSTILFFIVYIRQQLFSGSLAVWYDRIMLICDTIGLGIFTVVGSSAAIDAGYGDNRFLIVFVGVLTGVGGGMLRDMMAGTMPYIFVKHIYAVASLAGGLLFALIYPYLPRLGSMMTGAVFVMLLRYFAARYRWNLPRIR